MNLLFFIIFSSFLGFRSNFHNLQTPGLKFDDNILTKIPTGFANIFNFKKKDTTTVHICITCRSLKSSQQQGTANLKLARMPKADFKELLTAKYWKENDASTACNWTDVTILFNMYRFFICILWLILTFLDFDLYWHS